MNRDAKIVVVGAAGAMLASYFGFAFALWDCVPAHWLVAQRAGAVFVAAITAPIWIGAASCFVKGH